MDFGCGPAAPGGFLVDTNVLSEARKGSRADLNVTRWIKAHGSDLYVSVLVLGEIRRGIQSLLARDPAAADALERWLGELRIAHAERILPVDDAVADAWGRLSAKRSVPAVDGMLAATAQVHGLTVATRNLRHIAACGVASVNPFDKPAP